MSLPSFSVRNPVLVNMLMIVLLVAGGVFAFTLTREMFPESRPNRLLVTAVYPGVQPAEIEKAITIKVEEAVRDIDGVEKVNSTISEGFSNTVVALYNEVKDVDAVMAEVKNEVDALQDLPDDLEKITVNKLEPRLPVISAAIYGEGDEADLKRAARRMRDDLLLLPGVSDVQISGTREDEISVEIRPERLLEFDVTFDDVADAIRQSNLDVSGGQLKGERTTVAVRTLGEEYRGRDLEDVVVRSEPDGRKILVSDVAVVRDEFVDSDLESRFNGKPAVHCTVFKTGDQDAIQIAQLVKAYVRGKQGEPFDALGFDAAWEKPWYSKPFALLGAGVSWGAMKVGGRPDPAKFYEDSRRTPFEHNYDVALHTDLSRFIEGRLDLMLRNGRSGLILVLISLNLFLNWRVAFWAAVGLPVSFLGTFVVMWTLGATINLLTMFGLIIVLGIIVDDAIIIGENIYRHIELGEKPMTAAVKGAEEVQWPVTIAVATTIAAFAPLFFIKGQIGDFMGQLPIVVLSALSVSLIEALVILPAHLMHLPRKNARGQAGDDRSGNGFVRWLHRVGSSRDRVMQKVLPNLYERFLRFTLKWRYVTVAVAVALLMSSAGLMAGQIVKFVFIQKMDSETLVCQVELPVGSTGDNVRGTLQSISEFLTGDDPATGASRFPEVKNVQMHVARQYDVTGAGGLPTTDQTHLGQLVIELKAADQRDLDGERSSEKLLVSFRQMTGDLPGVNSVVWEELSGGPGGRDIHINVTGRDFDEIVSVADELKEELKGLAGVFDLDDDYDRGKREVQLRLREAARPTGITVGMLGSHVRSATFGRESRRITRNREDVKIMVRYPERFREDVFALESMWIPTPLPNPGGKRGWVPLGEVASMDEADSFTSIHRSQQQRAIGVFGQVDSEVTGTRDVLTRIETIFNDKIKPEHPGVGIEFLGQMEEMSKAFSGLKLAVPTAGLIIYMLLAGLFRSYFQPLVVMSAIPFGLMGAIVGHWLTDNPFTILSAIGCVALMGIIVNDSLVLVDFINARIRAGEDVFEASVQGGRLRLRAILLTTLTTAAGLTPIMFETSFQAKFLIPMAVTLTWGLIFATALTLVIVPSLNVIYFDVVHAVSGKWVNEGDGDAE